MTVPLAKLKKYFSIKKLIYHSVDLSLYQVSVIVEGKEQYVTDENGKFLRSTSLMELQKIMIDVSSRETVLRQTSAYDEMIGGPEKISSNMLEVPLLDNQTF